MNRCGLIGDLILIDENGREVGSIISEGTGTFALTFGGLPAGIGLTYFDARRLLVTKAAAADFELEELPTKAEPA